ncbi:MAG TPA: hypothetical protein VK750_05040, partial [Cytophagaceae bacterium]|nr:hypothetical protein [Cytophagaceae bacterium]
TLHMNEFPVTTTVLADLITLIDSGKVNYSVASQKIFPELLKADGRSPLKVAEELNLIQESDSSQLEPIVQEVLAKYPEKVTEYKNGKKGLMGLFVGEVMKASKGKADPKVTTALLNKFLDN